MADGHLNFDTKMNTSGFKTGIEQLSGMFKKLAGAVGIAFSVAAVVNFSKAAVQAASEMQSKFKGMEFLLTAHGRSMKEATSFIQEYTADGLVPMTSAYEAYKNMVSRGYETEQIEKMMKIMKDAAVYARQGQFSMGEAIEKTTMGLRMENSLLTDSVGIQTNVAKMWRDYAQEIGTTVDRLTLSQKRQAEFNGFMREGGVFAGAASEYVNTYAGRVAQLSASFLNLKIAVGNAIIPVINAIIPYIREAIDWFTRLFNIIGRVMNLLFGTNVGMADHQEAMAQSAKDMAEATGETADNTERAGKAAKGALAAFDMLYVLQQKTESGTGTGTGVLVPGTSEEKKTGGVGKELDELALKIREFYEKVKGILEPGGAGRFAIVISDEIIGALEKARKAVKNYDFKGLGNDLADGFNESLIIAEDFFNNFDFSGVGLNFGGLLSDAFKGGLDTGIAFVQTADWEQFANTIWAGIEGAFKFVDGLLEGVDWSEITSKVFELAGSGLGANVRIAVTLGTRIWEKLQEAWKMVKANWSESGSKDGDNDIWSGVLEGIKKAVANIGTWIKENIVDPFINGFKKGFGISSPSTVMAEQGGYLIDGMKKGIEDALSGISSWFAEKISDPLNQLFSDMWADIKKGSTDAGDDLTKTWEGTNSWFERHVTNPLKDTFEDAWNRIGEFMESPFEGLAEFVKKSMNGVIDFLNGLISSLVSGINSVIDLINGISIEMPQWAVMLGADPYIGFNIPRVTAPSIPYLASGAVIPPNAPFAAILGDQRSGRNLEAPEGMIRRIVREEAGNMGGGTLTVRFEGTMAALVRELRPALEFESDRVGGSMAVRLVQS